MKNLYRTLQHLEHTLAHGLDKQHPAAPPREKPKSSPRVWHAPASDTVYPSEQQIFKPNNPKEAAPMLHLTARALKVTAVLDPAVVATLPSPDGQARSKLIVNCDGINYTVDVATKSLRKVKTVITTNGADKVAVIVQGKLKGNEIIEAGIVAQVKASKQGESQ
jgi:hypothetical protein